MSSGVLRPRPDDFWTTYVDVGKPGCEAHYRAHWKTVDRWVEEVGKDELRAARAAEVSARREARRKPEKQTPASPVDDSPPDKWDLHAACHYLRDRVTVVGVRADGSYFVGQKVMLPSEVLTLALARGMDEWYVEHNTMAMLDIERGTDEWVLDRELTNG